MPRIESADPLHGYNFRAYASGDKGQDYLKYTYEDGSDAAFNTITVPELTIEAVEYKEGTMLWKRKYPGVPSWSDVTFSRGVTMKDTSFYDWIMAAAKGQKYRADITFYHYHREAMAKTPLDDEKSKKYHLKEGLPIRYKFAADLDATASEVSLMELDCSYEYAEIEIGT